MMASASPTTPTIGPMIAQAVTPLIALPPRTSRPCSVHTMPVRTSKIPTTRSTHFIPVLTHEGSIRFDMQFGPLLQPCEVVARFDRRSASGEQPVDRVADVQ